MKHLTVPQGGEDWFKLRAGKVTASQVFKIITPAKLELSKQRLGYLAQLLLERMIGQPILDETETVWMQAGTDQQDQAARSYEFETGRTVEPAGIFTTDDDLIGASPDGLVGPDRLLEIKGRKPVLHLTALLSMDDFRISHRPQVLTQMWVCERDIDDLYCYALARSPVPNFVVECRRDERAIGKLSAALRQFTDELLEKWEWLNREYGPFTRPDSQQINTAISSLGLSDDDAEYLVTRHRQIGTWA